MYFRTQSIPCHEIHTLAQSSRTPLKNPCGLETHHTISERTSFTITYCRLPLKLPDSRSWRNEYRYLCLPCKRIIFWINRGRHGHLPFFKCSSSPPLVYLEYRRIDFCNLCYEKRSSGRLKRSRLAVSSSVPLFGPSMLALQAMSIEFSNCHPLFALFHKTDRFTPPLLTDSNQSIASSMFDAL